MTVLFQCLTMEPPKLEQIKKWTVQNYKFTKQLVSEKFGHSTKTVDKELDVSFTFVLKIMIQSSRLYFQKTKIYSKIYLKTEFKCPTNSDL